MFLSIEEQAEIKERHKMSPIISPVWGLGQILDISQDREPKQIQSLAEFGGQRLEFGAAGSSWNLQANLCEDSPWIFGWRLARLV